MAKKTTDANNDYVKQVKDMYDELGDVFLSEEERKRKGIKKTYDEMRKQAQKLFLSGSINLSQLVDIANKINNSEKQALLQDDLDNFKTYEQKRQELVDRYAAAEKRIREAAANASETEKAKLLEVIDVIRREGVKTIADLDASVQKSTGLFYYLFQDASTMSTSIA